MEEWIDIIRGRVKDTEAQLPSDDWEVFEAMYLSNRRRRRLSALSYILLTTTAVASIVSIFFIHQADETIIKQENVLSSSPLSLSSEAVIPESDEMLTAPASHLERTNNIVRSADTSLTLLEKETVEDEEDDNDSFPAENEENTIEDNRRDEFQNDYLTVSRKTNGRFSVTPHLNGLRRSVSVDGAPFDQPYLSTPGGSISIIAPGANMNADHSLPLTFGIDVSYSLSDKLALTSGLELSSYKSVFTLPDDKQTAKRQTVYYLGIPLKLEWVTIKNGRFSIRTGAGGKVDRCVFARYNGKTVQDNRINWSVMADVGVQYDISDNIGIFMAPELSWYFKPENPALLTYRTENPLMLTIGAGLRISL
ncbi:MAG: hypothetical protein IJK05_08020 [Bacteroidales bacterium]|nr:hypothetical protein [Bacteroidales bacterium]